MLTAVIPTSLLLFLATFNVRGLSKIEKQHQLDEDCTKVALSWSIVPQVAVFYRLPSARLLGLHVVEPADVYALDRLGRGAL